MRIHEGKFRAFLASDFSPVGIEIIMISAQKAELKDDEKEE